MGAIAAVCPNPPPPLGHIDILEGRDTPARTLSWWVGSTYMRGHPEVRLRAMAEMQLTTGGRASAGGARLRRARVLRGCGGLAVGCR